LAANPLFMQARDSVEDEMRDPGLSARDLPPYDIVVLSNSQACSARLVLFACSWVLETRVLEPTDNLGAILQREVASVCLGNVPA